MSASLNLFDKEHASREKYVYFVCSLAGALFAYIGKDYFPEHPINCVGVLTIAALISFVLCIAFGMARIQVYTHMLGINRDVLVFEEEIAKLQNSWIAHEKGEAYLTLSNKLYENLKQVRIEELVNERAIKKETEFARMKTWEKWATGLLIISNGFLALGFILLLWAKIAG
jgi:hypothetical protein